MTDGTMTDIADKPPSDPSDPWNPAVDKFRYPLWRPPLGGVIVGPNEVARRIRDTAVLPENVIDYIIRTELKPRGLVLGHLAAALFMSRSTLTVIQRGDRSLTPDEALRLERLFGRPAEDFMAIQAAYELAQVRAVAAAPGAPYPLIEPLPATPA